MLLQFIGAAQHTDERSRRPYAAHVPSNSAVSLCGLFRPPPRRFNAQDNAPLHVAAWSNQAEMLEALLAAGADVNLADGEGGWTALHKALFYGNFRSAAVLLSAGADLQANDLQASRATICM